MSIDSIIGGVLPSQQNVNS